MSTSRLHDVDSAPPPVEGETRYRLHRRFDRMGRLVGDRGMARLFEAHVLVVGLGGVGSFAVEALVRSGIGRLTLVDFDRVCVTNTNRQLQALSTTVARRKADLLAERARAINPQVRAESMPVFYAAANSADILGCGADWVVDAIDNVTAKCHLLASAKRRGLPIVSASGASGRIDPTRIRVADLADTHTDPLANACRRILRQKYDFPDLGAFGIPTVFSEEKPAEPTDLHYDGGEGFRCVCPGGKNDHHSCEDRRVIYGTASFVTGTFGLTAASVVVRGISEG